MTRSDRKVGDALSRRKLLAGIGAASVAMATGRPLRAQSLTPVRVQLRSNAKYQDYFQLLWSELDI